MIFYQGYKESIKLYRNLNEITALIFVGGNINLGKNIVSNYKTTQIKIGFVSRLFSYCCCLNESWTHSILGYKVDVAEKLLEVEKDINVLNLITFSTTNLWIVFLLDIIIYKKV